MQEDIFMREKEVSDVWMLEETTTLDKLIIHEGAQIHTPDGKFVAMTINRQWSTYRPRHILWRYCSDSCRHMPYAAARSHENDEPF